MSITKNIKLSPEDRKKLSTAVKRIIGQLQAINLVIEENQVTDQTFTQLLAVKGGASRVCKDIISKGVLSNIKNYSLQELDQALDIIFKLD